MRGAQWAAQRSPQGWASASIRLPEPESRLRSSWEAPAPPSLQRVVALKSEDPRGGFALGTLPSSERGALHPQALTPQALHPGAGSWGPWGLAPSVPRFLTSSWKEAGWPGAGLPAAAKCQVCRCPRPLPRPGLLCPRPPGCWPCQSTNPCLPVAYCVSGLALCVVPGRRDSSSQRGQSSPPVHSRPPGLLSLPAESSPPPGSPPEHPRQFPPGSPVIPAIPRPSMNDVSGGPSRTVNTPTRVQVPGH